MTAQALNPAWQYHNDGARWWMTPVDHISWLPTGMDTPMNGPRTWECMNAWRMILIYAAPWLTVCSLWVGITRRVTLLALVSTIALSGTLLAVVGILERVTHPDKILWYFDPGRSVAYFVASFPYKNHAGAYFNLVLAVSGALAFWHFTRSDRRPERANPAPLFALCAVLAGMIVLLSYSRAATLLMLVFLLVSLVGTGVWLARSETGAHNRAVIGLLAAVLLLFVGGGGLVLNYSTSLERIKKLSTTDRELSIDGRLQAEHATWDMAKDKLLTGWGAGSFRYYFPVYEQNYPGIYNAANSRWEYAHNDYLQILAELGLVGASIFVAGAVFWVLKLLRHEVYRRPHAMILVLGLLLLMVHAWADLLLYCPAVLLTWCVLWTLTARWVEFEDNRVRD
jgi:O-antigen ligase